MYGVISALGGPRRRAAARIQAGRDGLFSGFCDYSSWSALSVSRFLVRVGSRIPLTELSSDTASPPAPPRCAMWSDRSARHQLACVDRCCVYGDSSRRLLMPTSGCRISPQHQHQNTASRHQYQHAISLLCSCPVSRPSCLPAVFFVFRLTNDSRLSSPDSRPFVSSGEGALQPL